MDKILGTGSRINHVRYGEGIVAGTKLANYRISFFGKGIIDVPKDSNKIEVLEEIAPEERMISVDDIETTLETILKK